MYTRKIKLLGGSGGKKKSKSHNPPGSSWGPRLALYEREKALSSHTQTERVDTSSYHLHHPGGQILRSDPNTYTGPGTNNDKDTSRTAHGDKNILRHRPPPPPSYKKISISSSSHDGSSCANNYIYNYSRKASMSSGTNKSVITSSASSNRSNSNLGGGSTYILGSNCGSHITFSNSSVGDAISQPLTLIIPSQDRLSGFESDFDEKSSSRYYDGSDEVVMDRDRGQDSFPSTRTYRSSGSSEDDEEDISRNCETRELSLPKKETSKKPQFNGPRGKEPPKKELLQTFSDPSIGYGILKVSSTKPQLHHLLQSKQEQITHTNSSSSPSSSNNGTIIDDYGISTAAQGSPNIRNGNESNNLNNIGGNVKKQLRSPEISNLNNISGNYGSYNNKTSTIGSTISSLAHGITMVYVPMESLPRSKSAAVLNASLEYDPELSDLVAKEKEIVCDVVEALATEDINKEDLSTPRNTDPDNDSLLESFDSIMFKPKDEQKLSPWSNASLSISSPETSPHDNVNNPSKEEKNNETIPIVPMIDQKQKLSRITLPQPPPPPLPPKNHLRNVPMQMQTKNSDKKNNGISKNLEQGKNIKSSLRQSEKNRNLRTAVQNLENIINPKSNGGKCGPNRDKIVKVKRVTLTLPREIPPNELMFNLNQNDNEGFEVDAYSSTFLTCGHVLKDDDYSTLSSSHSISPMHNKLNDRNEDGLNSAGEGDLSPTGSNSSGSRSEGGDPRPILQQLRELSILIGGGEYIENDKILTKIQNKNNKDKISTNANPKSFRLHEENPKRKTSDATDSGKGSESVSGSSPKSTHSSPDSELLKKQQHPINNPTQFCPNRPDKPCVFRADCNECLLYGNPPFGFKKPCHSEELCSNAYCNQKEDDILLQKKQTRINSNNNSLKKSSKLVRRKSSKLAKPISSKYSSKLRKKKPLILDYCDCNNCDAGLGIDCMQMCDSSCVLSSSGYGPSKLINREIQRNIENSQRKISSSSSSSTGSSSSVKLNRSVAFRGSNRSSTKLKISPLASQNDNNILFTIEETEESPSVELKTRKTSLTSSNEHYNNSRCSPPITKFNVGSSSALANKRDLIEGSSTVENNGDIRVSTAGSPHWHPNCWLAAADPMLGWSDLESLYSLNVKNDQPLSINGECWTCWQEISDIKKNSQNPNGTVDRTKRMFIWLNKRHREFQAPWWEAKKQASIRWVMTKALAHVPKEYLIDPFKESKKTKPTKYRLRDEVTRGLVSGKLYSLALDNLYRETLGGTGYPSNVLHHWDIIKILSRRGVYVAQPSDMKLTEGTLRQKPIRIAAHIAMIEAIMSLYSKEILGRERIIATLNNFGCTIKQETTSPEKLAIAWINAAVMTLKTYIMSTRNHQLTPEKQNRWLQLPQVGETRDLCDGVGICSLFAIYCSNDLKVSEIKVPDPGETLTIYDSITNHSLVQKLCEELFPETIYHLCVTDFLYIHGYMKENILSFLVDLFIHLEVNPILRVNRLTHLPIRVEL